MTIAHGRLASSWRRRLLHPWIAAVSFIVWFLWQSPLQWQYDSQQVYLGSRNILDWMQGRSNSVGQVGPYPLFQYISGVAALWAGRRGFPVHPGSLWSTCSLLSLAGIVVVFHCVAGRMNRPAVGWAIMVVMLSGPLLMYANCTFNESVAALLILCFTAAATGMAGPAVCAALFWASGITKETAPPLLAIIWLGGLWMRRQPLKGRSLIAQAAALLIAMLVTLATNAGFNTLRYGKVWNVEYLNPPLLVHSWFWRAQYCLALWLSPNGGIVPFWPTLAINMIGVIAIALRIRPGLAPALIVAVTLGGLTLGLSGWYQPFGWWAWGPRLMLPWMPACLLILLRGYPEAFARFVDRCVRQRRALTITAAITMLLALPHVMAASEPRIVFPFFANDWRYQHGVSAWQPEQQYAENVFLAWEKMPPMLVRPIIEQATLMQFALAACFLAALLILLLKCRSSLSR